MLGKIIAVVQDYLSEYVSIVHKQRTAFVFSDGSPKEAIGIIPVIQLNFPCTEEKGATLRK
jgi:hypothetical protein